MHTQDIRRKFITFFQKRGHTIVPSSSVVPHDDPTLLFINAGMNQFKDVFLGASQRDYKRAVTSQKCIRVGGKHNDLENVGHTQRHLTFFEMLGNFSFGDYFKKEAIEFAWELLTEVFGFPPEHLWPTVFEKDDEAFELWTAFVNPERITRFSEKTNFWAMGETGPCGPCSEILYDRGPRYGNAPTPALDVTEERYLEIWNLVFMQFNRDASGKLNLLPDPSIDTGSGLERVMNLLMNTDSVFETDILRSLIATVENLSKHPYSPGTAKAPAFRVIADHLRCLAFAIADGVQPSNLDRGYVLRKVLRRAVRYGRTLDLNEPFLSKLVPTLISTMGEDYPELRKSQSRIEEILSVEEDAFSRTLQRGGNRLHTIVSQSKGKKISGDDAFILKDTYGFPLEEILLLAKDVHLEVDTARFEELEKEAKQRSKQAHKTTQQEIASSIYVEHVKSFGASTFTGYESTKGKGTITAILQDGILVKELHEGKTGSLILDSTPFYAEKGGQTGDTGTLSFDGGSFIVSECSSPYPGIILHIGTLEKGHLKTGLQATCEVDGERRQKIANNHTATHLLHWGLHKVLGEHIKQAGSAVDDTRTRFDFNHHKALSAEEICKIEDLVNEQIRKNKSVNAYEVSYAEAQKDPNIKQFFGDKYGSTVRVIDLGDSKELCGGTHTKASGNIGFFRIVKEGSIAAGIRRIEAVTGKAAEDFTREAENILQERILKLLEESKSLSQTVKALEKEKDKGYVKELSRMAESINGMTILAAQVDGDIRSLAELLMVELKSGILLLASSSGTDKCQLLLRLSDDLVGKGMKANVWMKELAPLVEGSGGGKADMAQAGGKTPKNIPQVIEKLKELVRHS